MNLRDSRRSGFVGVRQRRKRRLSQRELSRRRQEHAAAEDTRARTRAVRTAAIAFFAAGPTGLGVGVDNVSRVSPGRVDAASALERRRLSHRDLGADTGPARLAGPDLGRGRFAATRGTCRFGRRNDGGAAGTAATACGLELRRLANLGRPVRQRSTGPYPERRAGGPQRQPNGRQDHQAQKNSNDGSNSLGLHKPGNVGSGAAYSPSAGLSASLPRVSSGARRAIYVEPATVWVVPRLDPSPSLGEARAQEEDLNAKDLKPAVLSILRPITTALIRGGVHPNLLSYLGLAASVLAGWAYAVDVLVLGALMMLVAGVFDLLDGAVAREGNRMSRYGAFLDSNLDRYAEIFVFVGILWRFQGEALTQMIAMLAITGSLMVSYTKARAEGLGEEVSGGMLQRPERIVLLALGSFFGEGGLRFVLWILALFTNFTSIQRMRLVAKSMQAKEQRHERYETHDVPMDSGEPKPAPPGV